MLIDYGKLNDGQYALETVLKASKDYVGKDKKAYCDKLCQELHSKIKSQETQPEQESSEIVPYRLSSQERLAESGQSTSSAKNKQLKASQGSRQIITDKDHVEHVEGNVYVESSIRQEGLHKKSAEYLSISRTLKMFLIGTTQLLVAATAVHWWTDIVRHPILSAGLVVLYELFVMVLVEVWERLKPEVVNATTDWVKVTMLNLFSRFRRRYSRHVIYEHRVFNVRGLRTKGTYIEVEQVFIELNIAHSNPYQASTNPLAFKELSDSQPIWKFLRRLKEKEATALAILGPPGCGKTTLLQHIALTFAANRQRGDLLRAYTPILLFLREHANRISKHSPSLDQLAQEHFSDLRRYTTLKPPPNWFLRQLKAGKCLVLLDGLDEVVDAEQRNAISAWVDRQIRDYPHCHFLLTARPQGYRDAPLTRAHVLEIMSFNDEQVKRFVHNWYLANKLIGSSKDDHGMRQDAEREARNLLQRLKDKPHLKELTVNPLLLTMIANVHNYRGVLPERRVELYAEICDVLLGHWQQAKGVAERLTPTQKRMVLQPLAEEMMTRKVRELPTQVVRAVITPHLVQLRINENDIEAFLSNIQQASSGVLVEKEAGYGVLHT